MARNIPLSCTDGGRSVRRDGLIAGPPAPVEISNADADLLIRMTLEIVLKLALATASGGGIVEPCQVLLNALRVDTVAAQDGNAGHARKHQGSNSSPRRGSATEDELTLREQGIMHSVTLGLSNKQIARKLGIGPETVKTHISNILLKLDVRNRTQAVALANSRGLIRLDTVSSEFTN